VSAGRTPGEPVFLLTGAAGGIGRMMGRELARRGIAYKGADVVTSAGPGPFLKCDLADPAARGALREFCADVTHVIHLAGRVSNEKRISAAYAEQHRMSVTGTLNLLGALGPSARHVAFASSMTVYGRPKRLPVDETHPLEPSCVYAVCKVAAERHLAAHARRTGLRAASLRYTGIYGPGDGAKRAIQTMIQAVLEGRPPEVHGDGSVRRDYMYHEDLCRVTVDAALKEADGVFNVGTGRGTSVAELARLILKLSGRGGEPVFVPKQLDAQSASSMVFDVSKLSAALGGLQLTPIEEGLARTIAYCKAAYEGEAKAPRPEPPRPAGG
jgi:UDP-glucose 4-epimerase